MKYIEAEPNPRLSHIIKRYWSLESDDLVGEPETILPDGCPEIVFNLSDRFERIDGSNSELQPATLFAGQISRSISIRPTGKVSLFGVRFHPTGAFTVGRISQNELTDKIFDIESIFGRRGSDLEEAINLEYTFESRIAIFERFVFANRPKVENTKNVCTFAADYLNRTAGNTSIAKLADMLNISERNLERKFREQVGLSPKKFARIVRFQNVVRSIESAAYPSFLDIALSFGYFDQSHLIRDFQEFGGQSPLEYFEATHRMSTFFISEQ